MTKRGGAGEEAGSEGAHEELGLEGEAGAEGGAVPDAEQDHAHAEVGEDGLIAAGVGDPGDNGGGGDARGESHEERVEVAALAESLEEGAAEGVDVAELDRSQWRSRAPMIAQTMPLPKALLLANVAIFVAWVAEHPIPAEEGAAGG